MTHDRGAVFRWADIMVKITSTVRRLTKLVAGSSTRRLKPDQPAFGESNGSWTV